MLRFRALASAAPALVALACATGCQCGSTSDGQPEPPARAAPDEVAAPRAPAAGADRNQGAISPVALPGRYHSAPWLAEATRVAALEVDGEPRVVAAGLRWLRLHRPDGELVAEAEAPGVAQVLAVADVDGDGHDDLIVARGRGRGALDAPATLQVFRSADLTRQPEVIALPETTRAQIIGVVAVPGHSGRLWLGLFVSKYMVELIEAERADSGTWSRRALATVRVALGLAAADVDGDGQPELVVARPYGDSLEADGDVFVLRDGEREALPSRRGARAVIALARPGRPDAVAFTDGWHREYGARAQALITMASREQAGWNARVLAHVRDRHGYDRLAVADTDGDGQPEIVAAGNGPAVLVDPASSGRPAREIGSEDAHDLYPFDLDGDGADEVLVAGPVPGIWSRAKSH